MPHLATARPFGSGELEVDVRTPDPLVRSHSRHVPLQGLQAPSQGAVDTIECHANSSAAPGRTRNDDRRTGGEGEP